MNALSDSLEDPLRPLGVVAGTFLVLAALGTIAGAPWATHATIASAILQLVGAILMIIVGGSLAYLSWTNDE
ncbi:hypothetical protein [Haloarcula marina]|uniref:hypothetical protein n=1 Tax=Haloarcula marina TaxID=2961574 RepID=UPI0020B70174|nr:hypothetical protein [Halomicroarcula marina]